MAAISVMVPSRGRPQNIAALLEAWADTRSGDSHLHVVLDQDDPTIDGYTDVLRTANAEWVTAWLNPGVRLGGALNHVAPFLARHDAVIGFMGDDHRPRSFGWDVSIDGLALRAPGYVAYGNDLIQGPALPTAVFLDARIVRELGHFVLPGQLHLFMDNYWKTLGEQLGTLRYLPEVIIEHVHPIAGKAEWDEGYTANNDEATWQHDEAIYNEWVAHQMPADVARLKEVLGGSTTVR